MNLDLLKTKFKFKLKPKHRKKIIHVFRLTFWFLLGAFLCIFFVVSFAFFAYEKFYERRIFEGISVGNVDFGGKPQKEVEDYFNKKNSSFGDKNFLFTSDHGSATISAKTINFGFDSKLLANQAYSLGRSESVISNFSLILQAYFIGLDLSPSYMYNEEDLKKSLSEIAEKVNRPAVDALFRFENGRVTAFKPSSEGKELDFATLNKKISEKTLSVVSSKTNQTIIIPIPIKVIEPEITTDQVNNFGIKELIGEGHSLFYHSIPSRIYNVNLASSRVNGILVAPGEVFSFDKALGDVSSFTGYQQAYIIQNGKTVLGDGGGVCQVSTTFFRAVLDAGLPIVERTAHAYRVGYYEQDSPPGIDATVFVPTVDLKFKNDTDNYILIQSEVDLNNLSLSYYLYGTNDGRKTTTTKPVVTNLTPPPADLHQDDPTLPVGTVKQVDFAAWGANVSFARTVTKNGKIIIQDTFVSNYRPWQAVFLHGTKQ